MLQAGTFDFLPSAEVLHRPFSNEDKTLFMSPQKVFYPEIWVDCLCGNLSREGITADLESIAEAGFSGVQMFFGNRGGAWPGVRQISCLSPEWEEFVRFAAEEAHRLGLRFTLQNCPGWAMAGGPWITPDKAMRHLVWSTTITSSPDGAILPVPEGTGEEWRDYRDLMVLAFPTPKGEEDGVLPYSIDPGIIGTLPETVAGSPHVFEITLDSPMVIRTVEFPSVQLSNHWFSYDPGISARMEALYDDGGSALLFDTEWPQSNWQDDRPLSLACNEVLPATRFRLEITNSHAPMNVGSFRLFSCARKNGWESEAAWCLRSILRNNDSPQQDPACWVDGVMDLSGRMDAGGRLSCSLPEGKWTILRVGHVNTGKQNAPAPPEATGFECDKFSYTGADSHFAGYIGRLSDGPLNGLLDGMLMDSWECETQTWTPDMEEEFLRVAGYGLRPWIPALMGYVVRDPETTARFLCDWRTVVNDLVVNKFYGRMAELGHDRGLSVTYETAGGDVFPSDIMEYFKFADIPMCEFWVHDPEVFVGTLDFKPIKPTASAGHLYGKPRVAAEAFTSMQQTWDERLSTLRETANRNCIEGASYLIYQAYTHNPAPGRLVPGSSFGDGIGTPFLRAQTWWRYMHDFNDCTARTSFMLERGVPVADVLWYLGDEIDHKPHQEAAFPEGFRYDYCNPDVLLNRLSVKDGCIVTPEGLEYGLLWLPESYRFLPETLEKMLELVKDGATIVGDRPLSPATLRDPGRTQRRFDHCVEALWGADPDGDGVRHIGKGRLISGRTLGDALRMLGMEPDVKGQGAMWLHRRTDGAEWYYVCAPKGGSFDGSLSFRCEGGAEIWNPLTGETAAADYETSGGRTTVRLSLARAETCFVVITPESSGPGIPRKLLGTVPADGRWTLSIPEGWGMDGECSTDNLAPLRDLDISQEARSFSGTMTYRGTITLGRIPRGACCTLDLGRVEQIARVTFNGETLRPLWTEPYAVDVSGYVRKGRNEIVIEVTDTWYNRLVYDSALDEGARKTWTTNFPPADAPVRDSGLIGPVVLRIER